MPLLGHIHAVSVVEGCKISHWTQHRGSSWFLYGGQHRCPCGRPIFRRCVGCEVCHPVVSTNKCGPLLQYRYMCTPGQECLWPRHCLNLMATVFIAHAKISYGDIMRVQKRQAVFAGPATEWPPGRPRGILEIVAWITMVVDITRPEEVVICTQNDGPLTLTAG